MKNNLEHLPTSRRKHLAHIVSVLRDEVEQVTAFSSGKKKHSRILKIILFGSHATGKWVNDPAHGYVSDYDILVILNNRDLIDEHKIWGIAEERIALKVRPPLNILLHSLGEVNAALSQGQYFFSDIKRQGIVLFETGNHKLVEAGNLTQTEYKDIAEKNYKQWFESAVNFYSIFSTTFDKGLLKEAAFILHQATERFYACLLLILTNYKPNTHNLVQLNALAILQNENLTEVFPQDTKLQRSRFQLLKKAYIEARYSEHYEITEAELKWLAGRVRHLQQLTEKLCKEKIESFDLKS